VSRVQGALGSVVYGEGKRSLFLVPERFGTRITFPCARLLSDSLRHVPSWRCVVLRRGYLCASRQCFCLITHHRACIKIVVTKRKNRTPQELTPSCGRR
jgi:hypothetical protein